jgi:prepilin-type processing-associated H-X9-DG protein
MLFPPLTNPNAIPDPNSSLPIIQSIYSGCLQRGNIGHTDWTYANSIYDGFTTALPPEHEGTGRTGHRRGREYGGREQRRPDLRGGHRPELPPGGVNVLFGDGSGKMHSDGSQRRHVALPCRSVDCAIRGQPNAHERDQHPWLLNLSLGD